MPRHKVARVTTDKDSLNNEKSSRKVTKTSKKISNNDIKSMPKSQENAKHKTCKEDKKPLTKESKKSQVRVSKREKYVAPADKQSDYFTVTVDDNVQSSAIKTKSKSKKASYASKLKSLKDGTETDDDSEEEFEAMTVTYRSPKLKKEPASKILRNKDDTETSDKMSNKKENSCSSKKEERQSTRKRKSNSLGETSEDNETVVKKLKKTMNVKSKTSRKASEITGEDSKSLEVTKKKVESIKKGKKTRKGNPETDNIISSIPKDKTERTLNKSASKVTEVDAVESDDEEMMDVSDSPVNEPVMSEDVGMLTKSVDYTDAMAVLMHMEGPKQSSQPVVPSTSKLDSGDVKPMSDDDSDVTDEENSEWEDVEDHHGNSPKKSQLPSGPVEITLDAPVIYKKRKKGEFDINAYFKRQINKFKREVAMDIHKVHLMCLLGRCQYLNRMCQDETVQAQALSLTLITKELKFPRIKSCTENHVTQALNWIREKKHYLNEVMADNLKEFSSQVRLILICVILLQQVGFLTRIMMSLQAVPFRETSSKKGKSTKSASKNPRRKSDQKSGTTKTETKKAGKPDALKVKKEKVTEMKADPGVVPSDRVGDTGKGDCKGRRKAVKRRSSDRKCSKVSENAYKDHDGSDGEAMNDAVDDEFIPGDDGDDYNEISEVKRGKGKGRRKKAGRKADTKADLKIENPSDDDFEEDSILIQTQLLKKESPGKKNKKVLSSDNESDHITGVDNWAEVYLEKEQTWICIDCIDVQVKKPYELENKASQPISYVVGITQEGHIRDLTARYASQWLTETRKLRVDTEWWQDTLEPYKCPDSQKNALEDAALNSHLQQRPLPTSVGGFKSHPLYALRRHLLKFEAIYPDSAIPVGYIKGEPVYARECVHTLHSRENWLKEGRAVRIGEDPYKFVKSRPKWNRPKEDPEAKDLELFGNWQTELYIPPPAVDGKVPRNAHGNVEMFLPSMLPAGTVHLKMAGLNKVAKKLDIDCAPAMVGWDHHCGFSHPQMDGWIVCEEHKDILLAAWDEEQEIIREKEQQKREKRVYDNWKKLIRGMLIKERLKKRFDLEERTVEESLQANEECEGKNQLAGRAKGLAGHSESVLIEKAEDKKHAWPQSRINGDPYTLGAVEKL